MKTDRIAGTRAGAEPVDLFDRKNRIGVNRKVAQSVDTRVVTADSVRRPTPIVRGPLAELASIGMPRIPVGLNVETAADLLRRKVPTRHDPRVDPEARSATGPTLIKRFDSASAHLGSTTQRTRS